jgi:hypothetical protein
MPWLSFMGVMLWVGYAAANQRINSIGMGLTGGRGVVSIRERERERERCQMTTADWNFELELKLSKILRF